MPRENEIVNAIRQMWEENRRLPPGSNAIIEANIHALMARFGMHTYAEWHKWCRVAETK